MALTNNNVHLIDTDFIERTIDADKLCQIVL